jgi:hypothetical protein
MKVEVTKNSPVERKETTLYFGRKNRQSISAVAIFYGFIYACTSTGSAAGVSAGASVAGTTGAISSASVGRAISSTVAVVGIVVSSVGGIYLVSYLIMSVY